MEKTDSGELMLEQINGSTVAFYAGAIIASEADALDAIGSCYGRGVDLMVLPVEQLSESFFRLSTGLAGAVLQKFQNYGPRVAILGDISKWTAPSQALRDFVTESNRRGQTLFASERSALEARV